MKMMGVRPQPEVPKDKNGAHHMTSDVLKNPDIPEVPV
jgi:hypothetical protein